MITLYGENLKAIQIIIEGLNEIEKKLKDAGLEKYYLKSGIPLMNAEWDDESYGEFRDEIGGDWSWTFERKPDVSAS